MYTKWFRCYGSQEKPLPNFLSDSSSKYCLKVISGVSLDQYWVWSWVIYSLNLVKIFFTSLNLFLYFVRFYYYYEFLGWCVYIILSSSNQWWPTKEEEMYRIWIWWKPWHCSSNKIYMYCYVFNSPNQQQHWGQQKHNKLNETKQHYQEYS